MRYDGIRRRVTAICNKHHLLRIDLTIIPGSGLGGYVARAMPAPYHPIVEARWRRAMEYHRSAPDTPNLELISENAMESIAAATGSSVEGALKLLHETLDKQNE